MRCGDHGFHRNRGSGHPTSTGPEIAYTDAQIGRLLDAINARPDRDRTLILMVSDHGEELWERETQRRKLGYHDRAGHGHSQYQELLHVPGILDIPGHPPGELYAGTEMIDLFPTVLGLLAIKAPGHQGRDLRPQIVGQQRPEPLRLSGFQLYGDTRWAARWGSWKLVVKDEGREVVELYHLTDDPDERHNLARTQTGVVRDLRRRAEIELAAPRRAGAAANPDRRSAAEPRNRRDAPVPGLPVAGQSPGDRLRVRRHRRRPRRSSKPHRASRW